MSTSPASRTDLRAVIELDLGPPPGRRGCQGCRPWWHCPFHDDRNPSFTIVPGGSRWRCFGCGAAGDAIDWVRRRNPEIGFQEAKRHLGLSSTPTGEAVIQNSTSLPAPSHEKPPARRSARSRPRGDKPDLEPEQWQNAAKEVVRACESVLWSPQGQKARTWLARRGLRESTVRRFRLGFNPGRDEIAGLVVARGITIPWLDGDRVLRIKIRLAAGRPKFLSVPGAPGGGLYPTAHLSSGTPALVLEGEFDTLLAGQELSDLVSAVTYGSASDKPSPRQLRPLLVAPLVLVATDADPAGDEFASDIGEMLHRARRLRPVGGRDLTEMFQSGADLRHWILEALNETGWAVDASRVDPDAVEFYEERAAILEYEADLTRKVAEDQALTSVPRMFATMAALIAQTSESPRLEGESSHDPDPCLRHPLHRLQPPV